MKLPKERLDAIIKRFNESTEGPWSYVPVVDSDEFAIIGEGGNEIVSDRVYTKEDAEFIANVRGDIAALLVEVALLRGELRIAKGGAAE